MSNEEANFRRLVIKNYRNLAPFYSGSADNSDSGAEFLTVNRSLNREELGGIVTLIGVNNSGKTNVLEALLSFGFQKFVEDDYTDFLISDKVEPSVEMNVANGMYGNGFKLSGEGFKSKTIKGPFLDALFRILMEEESFDLYKQFVGRQHEAKANEEQWMKEAYNQVYGGNGPSALIKFILSEREVLMAGGGSFCDYYNKNAAAGYNTWSVSRRTAVKEDVEIISDGTPLNCDINSQAAEVLKRTEDSPIDSPREDGEAIIDGIMKFEKKYGYILSNEVISYEREEIKQSEMTCLPSDPNWLVLTILEHLGFSEGALKNAYSNPMLRSKLERKINESLVKLSEEFNDLLNIDESRYSFNIRLEKENIDIELTYGDDVPLDIDKQSEGFRWLFDFYIGFILGMESDPGTIILLDEFGNSLGFSTVKELVKKLRRFAQSRGLTFVIATQNVMAVDILHLDEIRLIVPMEDGSAHIVNNFDHFGDAGSHDVMGPVISGLMVSRNFMRTEGRRTVFVEGATDYFYLNAFSEALRSQGKEVDIDFIPINGLGGRGDSPSDVLSQIRSIERFPTILVDGDKAGEKFISIASNRGVKPSSISEIFGEDKKEIEDLFSKKDAEKFRVAEKSFDIAACFSHKLCMIYDEIEEETKMNFEKAIDYLMAQ